MIVKVKYMDEHAAELYREASKDIVEGGIDVPFKKYEEDFCYDCVAVSCEQIAPRVYKYGLGIALQIEDEGLKFLDRKIILDIDARPRSSVHKTGMILSNCEGTVDKIYTGQIYAVFYHVLDYLPKYEVGDKICQIKIGATVPMEFKVVDELDATTRGNGGFGSTGK
jgi:dUTP pyrophosphatase